MELSPRDVKRLLGVHPDLVGVIMRAAEITQRPFFVSEGVRTAERQQELWNIGRRGIVGENPVTWTLQSKHLINKVTGYGHATDLYPIPDAGMPIPKIPLKWYEEVNDAMQQAAAELGKKVRWGANWDQDKMIREKGETDNPHWELA